MTTTPTATTSRMLVSAGLIAALLSVGLTGCGGDSDADSTAAKTTTTANGTKQTDDDPTTTVTTAATSSTTAPIEPNSDLTATAFGDIKIGSTEQAVRDALTTLKADVTDGIPMPCFSDADKTIAAGGIQFAITGGKLSGYWVDSTFGTSFPTALTVLGGQKFLGTQVGSIKPVGLSTAAEKIEPDGTIVRSLTDTQPPFRIVAEPGGMVISGGVAPTACISIG